MATLHAGAPETTVNTVEGHSTKVLLYQNDDTAEVVQLSVPMNPL